MNRISCDTIRDILPLYVDEVVSEDTKKLVSDHLEQCEKCQEKYEKMRSEITIPIENTAQPLKEMKKRMKKKTIITVVLSALVVTMIFFAVVNLRPVSIEYGSSELYTQQDMDAAIDIILEQIDSWEGCKLYSISYLNDEHCIKELEYCNELADEGVVFTECIVFSTCFRSPIFGGGAWRANSIYDWTWCLARTENGEWQLLTWGVC